MDSLKHLYSKFNLSGKEWQDAFVEFVDLNNYEKDDTYNLIFHSEPKEQTKNGFYHDWQREAILQASREGMSDQDILHNLVIPWHASGLLNKLWTTGYHYRYDIPSLDTIRKLVNEEERFACNIKRNIGYYLKKISGKNLFRKFIESKGYVNAKSKPLKHIANVETKVNLNKAEEKPIRHLTTDDILKDFDETGLSRKPIRGGKRTSIENFISRSYVKYSKPFKNLDTLIPGEYALCYDYIHNVQEDKWGYAFRIVKRSEPSRRDRIWITSRCVDYFQSEIKKYKSEEKDPRYCPIYEDEYPELFNLLKGKMQILNEMYGR